MSSLLKTTASDIIHKILTCLSIEKDFKANVENDKLFSVATDDANHGDTKMFLINYLLLHGQKGNNPFFQDTNKTVKNACKSKVYTAVM